MYGREGNGTSLQYSWLENPMDGGAWWAPVHEVAKSQAPLSDFTFIFHFHALEKEMESHSSILAWRIPGTKELVGCRLWGRTESDTTEVTEQQPRAFSFCCPRFERQGLAVQRCRLSPGPQGSPQPFVWSFSKY